MIPVKTRPEDKNWSCLFDFSGGGMAVLVVALLSGCIERYYPPESKSPPRNLVVYGFINSDDSVACVQLSWSQSLTSTTSVPVETGAEVALVDDSGNTYPLEEQDNGEYTKHKLVLDSDKRHKLRIRTASQREYESTFISVKKTPAIDSIRYQVDKTDQLKISVNTHDDSGKTRFYRWRFIETYEYNAHYSSLWTIQNGGYVPRPASESLRMCWRTDTTHKIVVASTEQFSKDLISDFNLITIQRGSFKIGRKYSVMIEQQALSDEAFDYWLSMQQSSESLGGLYDPTPPQSKGNIRSLSSPNEEVLGIFESRSTVRKRIFILPEDLPYGFAFLPRDNCAMDTVAFSFGSFPNPDLMIDIISLPGPDASGSFVTSRPDCIDCRLKGGVITKPAFWD
jgi:hypothetical protein